MKRIGKVVNQAIPHEEALRMAKAQKALRRWAEAVGPILAEKSRPERYERGTVWVAVDGSSWAQELRLNKDQILSKLRAMANDGTLFEKLRFGVRSVEKTEETEPAIKPITKVTKRPDLDGLSIREIAERRMKMMDDEGRT